MVVHVCFPPPASVKLCLEPKYTVGQVSTTNSRNAAQAVVQDRLPRGVDDEHMPNYAARPERGAKMTSCVVEASRSLVEANSMAT